MHAMPPQAHNVMLRADPSGIKAPLLASDGVATAPAAPVPPAQHIGSVQAEQQRQLRVALCAGIIAKVACASQRGSRSGLLGTHPR